MKAHRPWIAILMLTGCSMEGLPQLPSNIPPMLPGGITNPNLKPIPLPRGKGNPTPAEFSRVIPTLSGSETGVKVHINKILWPASSYVLATNRNHVEEHFPNGAAKLEKLKELRPNWGAGRYMYRIGHGPTDGRFDYDYMTGYHFEQSWGKKGSYPYDDIRHSLKEANTLDAEQLHVINFGTGTPEEAGRYVSYLNNPQDSNRSSYPIANQNAKYFELGNEISWSMVRGHNEYASNENVYAQRAKKFAQAMRKASKTPLEIGMVATTNSNWMGDGWSGGATTIKNILTTMGNDVDFLIYHGYPSWPLKKDGDLMSIMAQNAWNQKKLSTEILPAIKQYATHPVYIANTEFFTELYSDSNKARAMFGALYSADTLALSFNNDIRIANQFCLDHGEQSDASFFINNDPNRVTPIFQFQKMLSKHWGNHVVQVETQNVPTVHVQGADDSIDMPKLAFSASVSQGKAYVMIVNRTNDSSVNAKIATGINSKNAIMYQLSGNNGWDSMEDASIKTMSVDPSQTLSFPRSSVSILEIPITSTVQAKRR